MAEERGLTFYQVLTLASIVEREAVLDEERPLIAGVYQNRIDGIQGVKNKILNADPTVIYGVDTRASSPSSTSTTGRITSSGPCPKASHEGRRAARGAGRATTRTRSRACLPGRSRRRPSPSIDAALHPDTKDKYIYFLAIPDGSGAHVVRQEHRASTTRTGAKYGYT